ncbi:MAG: LysR family transcriptional regulator [Coriobacteriales bacterium]
MALDSWSWFIQLAQKGNFTRAAEELGISQQTLSARLASLERELDAKLIVRSTPLTLTPAGTEFLAFATEQEQARTELVRRVGEASNGGVGVLKVAIGNMRAWSMMPAVITEFRKGLPGVRVELIEGTNEDLLRMAERGEVDIVVARFDRSHPGVIARPLFEEEVVVAIDPGLLEKTMGCPAQEAVRRIESKGLALLRECPFLLEEDDDIAGRIGQTEMKKAGIKQEGVVKAESMTVLLALCRQGLGAVFSPLTLLDAAQDSAQLLRIHLPEPARYQISVGRPANAEPWTPAQTFEDIIGALFGD